MSAAINVRDLERRKRVAIVASQPAVSPQTGWPVGFWWAELTHPYSPIGGELEGDSWGDPRDPSKYSAEDILSLGFICSPQHSALVENSKPLAALDVAGYDDVMFVGGQGPMYNFYNDERVHNMAADFYEAGKVTAVICHATCILLKTRLRSGALLVDGKTWTGFANSEEEYADSFAGQRNPAVLEQGRSPQNPQHSASSRQRTPNP